MKSHKRFSKASGTTKRLVERIVADGERAVRRRFVAAERDWLREAIRDLKGELHEG